ncbi:class II aldolase/adducin family protein [Staphylospora marina]|uniref:class II aldolase/adducin family protein n=1 Tax=Staphylospora marina TaxID=2490858 RepID=UPI000F5BDA0A|nr:class II aldolase/adducin family protein [Staphylospora marina]
MDRYYLAGDWNRTPTLQRFKEQMKQRLEATGYVPGDESGEDIRIVLNAVDPDHPRHFRRKGKGTFVVTVAESDRPMGHVLRTAYPVLVRSLGNLLIWLDRSADPANMWFVTLEQGCYSIPEDPADGACFDKVFERLLPLATSRLVIDNIFEPDLPEHLHHGDDATRSLSEAGKKLDRMNLLPAPFPIEELLSPRELRHIKRLYGIGGLSYGNLSVRQEGNRFWMSASGVNKADLREIGRDILLIKDFDEEKAAMRISVPPHVEPKRASVDAIEHWMIYTEHPEVGAIVHIHAWMEGVRSTEINYPCGTVQLAEAVADLVRQADDPAAAVVGLKNHGLTITGRNLEDIFQRIEGKIIPQVPMN